MKYSADTITELTPIEGVRKRPNQYIPYITHPLHLVYEIMANSGDESLAGYGDVIKLHLLDNNGYLIEDYGRGIPPEKPSGKDKTAITICFTVLHGGSKVGDNKAEIYEKSFGDFSVGATVVNALSTKTIVTVKRNGKIYRETFSKGSLVGQQEIIGTYNEKKESTGTTVEFYPDGDIFESLDIPQNALFHLLNNFTYINNKLTIELLDDRTTKKLRENKIFNHPRGMIEYMEEKLSSKDKDIIYPIVDISKDTRLESRNLIEYQVLFTHLDTQEENVVLFANGGNMINGGTPLTAFKSILTKAVNESARKQKLLRDKDNNLDSRTIGNGLYAIISTYFKRPMFKTNAKTEIEDSKIMSEFNQTLYNELLILFEDNPIVLKGIVDKSLLTRDQQEKIKKLKDSIIKPTSKKKNNIFNMPDSLKEASIINPKENEIFIVEGKICSH